MKTILIIDDNFDTLNSIERILRQFGYQVMSASDGQSALSCFNDGHKVDLVITDYQMPGMNGLELVSRLKQIAPSVPVIMASTFVRTDIYLKALALDVAEFIEKPIRPQALKLILEDIL